MPTSNDASMKDPQSKTLHPTRSDFDLEPNPFEQSFSRPSNIRQTSSRHRDSTSPVSNHSSNKASDRPVSSSSSNKHDAPHRHSSPPPILPPLAALSSPSAQSLSAWQFSSSLSNSLRAGPLSPAMLAGPQQISDSNSQIRFDPTTFRTGLTPRTGFTPSIGLTPRTGLTPGTGLTPLLGGPVSFPTTSPNTAAFLALMNNNSASAAASSNATITPNTLSAISGVLNAASNRYIPNSSHQPIQPSNLSTSHTSGQENQPGYLSSASDAATTAANGLFLLSQAHQELTKREEAQARAGAANASNNSRHSAKRKSEDFSSSPPAPAARNGNHNSGQISSKRSRGSGGRGRRTSPRISEGMLDEDEEEEDDEEYMEAPSGNRKQQKKPETEEEKRRNFLERNRQAALKCRQRKKAWLSQLQTKVEFLSTENERLTNALVASREEISRLSALVGGAGVGPRVSGPPMGPGVSVNSVNGGGSGTGRPVSMNINLAGENAPTGTRAGYGY